MIDTSKETIRTHWRALLAEYGLSEDGVADSAKVERGEPVSIADYTAEQLADARSKTSAQVDEMLRKPIALFAKWFAPNWHITDEEIDELVPLYAELIAKHYPDLYMSPTFGKLRSFFTGYGLELRVLLKTYDLFNKRKGIPRKKQKKKQEQPEQPEQPAEEMTATTQPTQGKEV